MTTGQFSGPPLSIPARARIPRPLTPAELRTLDLVADALIPARDDAPAASEEPDFIDQLVVALDARADAFEAIVGTLARLAPVAPAQMFDELRVLHDVDGDAFQALSTVIAGAWLLTPGVRDRIGYHGQRSEKAGLEEAADQIASGILDPVLDRDPATGPHWVR